MVLQSSKVHFWVCLSQGSMNLWTMVDLFSIFLEHFFPALCLPNIMNWVVSHHLSAMIFFLTLDSQQWNQCIVDEKLWNREPNKPYTSIDCICHFVPELGKLINKAISGRNTKSLKTHNLQWGIYDSYSWSYLAKIKLLINDKSLFKYQISRVKVI